MDLAGKIDPVEVLTHLNQMGYRNITPMQLKEFIQDLKKLITYDRLSSSSGSLTSLTSSTTYQSEYYSSSESSFNQEGTRDANKGSTSTKNVNRSAGTCSKSTSVPPHSGGGIRRSLSSSSSLAETWPQKENVPVQKRKTKLTSEENLQEAIKPRSSFIRPWQLQGVPSATARSGTSDPVSLYHYYQTLWSKRKCPGEDSHADLRWVIREKMLGQDPHLYSKTTMGKRDRRLRL